MSEKPSWLLFLYGSNDEFQVHEELSHRKWYEPGEMTPMGPKPAGPPRDWAHTVIFQDRSTGLWHALSADKESHKSLSASYEWMDNLLPRESFAQLDISQYWGSNLLIDRCVILYKCTKAYMNADEERHEEKAIEASRNLKRRMLDARRKEVERAREIEQEALQ